LLRPIALHEIPQLSRLAHDIWQAHYPAVIGQQQVDYMLATLYSEASLQHTFEAGEQLFYFVEENNTTEGFVAVSFPQPQECFINKLYVRHTQQRGGIGGRTLQSLENIFPQADIFRLQVNRQNYKAINFYFKNGFVIEQVADFDIGQGFFMNDFIMTKKKSQK